MNTKKVVITGGPGTGKSSIINELIKRNYICFEEISRQVILDARKQGIEQLFLTEPLLFSELLLKARTEQYLEAENHKSDLVFLDRGLPDVLAYMHYANSTYPQSFIDTCEQHAYHTVFVLAPWQDIYTKDNERYESFEQAIEIHDALLDTYSKFGYELIDVPFTTIEARADFILEHLDL